MTIAGWVLFGILTLCIIGFGFLLSRSASDEWGQRGRIASILISIGLVIAILCGMLFYFNHTESGKRAYHTQESDLNGGLIRTVRVYDVEGDIIAEYSGRFDVEHNEDRILFDDENGNRHIIYFSVATVVIDECEE